MDQFSTEQAERLQQLFDAALNLDPSARESYVMDSGADLGPGFVDRVLAMLDAYDNVDSILRPIDATAFDQVIKGNPKDPFELIGKDFHGYKIEGFLGGGGMGVVYKARDAKLARHVAIKLLPPHLMLSEEAEERFVREAQAASPMDHRNIATVYDIGEMDDGGNFIVMAYYEGETIKEKIQKGSIDLQTAVDYSVQIATGLEQAHQHGVIHRDIKPANLMVTENGDVKILDFGLAQILDSEKHDSDKILGTPKYMSPEQTRGEPLDERTDIWSLGMVMYEMLIGEAPFVADNRDSVFEQIRNDKHESLVTLNPDTTPLLSRAVDKSLQKSLTRRYSTSTELLRELRDIQRMMDPGVTRRFSRSAKLGMSAAVIAACAFLFVQASPEGARSTVNQLGFKVLPEMKRLAVLPRSFLTNKEKYFKEEQTFVESLTPLLDRISTADPNLWVLPQRQIAKLGKVDLPRLIGEQGINLVLFVDKDSLHYVLELMDVGQNKILRRQKIELDGTSELVAVERAIPITRAWFGVDPAAGGVMNREDLGSRIEILHRLDRADALIQNSNDGSDFETAIMLLEQSIELDPNSVEAIVMLAGVQWRLYEKSANTKHLNAAEKYVNEALLLDPNSTNATLVAAKMRIRRNLLGEGLFYLNNLMTREDIDAHTYMEIGSVYAGLDERDKAEAAYKRAIDLKSDYWYGYAYMAYFYFQIGEYEKSRDYYSKAVEFAPGNMSSLINLAYVEIKLGNKIEGIRLLERSLKIEPTKKALEAIGDLHFESRNYVAAEESYRDAIEVHPNNYESWSLLAGALRHGGKKSDSIEAYTKALELSKANLEENPFSENILINVAQNEAYLELRESAIQTLKKLEDINPSNGRILANMAYAYELIKERDKAVYWLERGIEAGYSFSELQTHPDFVDLFNHVNGN